MRPPTSFQADPHLSPYTGANNLISIHQLVENATHHNTWDKTTFGHRAARFLELYLGWRPLNVMTMVTQHEVFGHGYRIREFDKDVAKIHSYEIGLPFPYGLGGGATAYEVGEKMTPTHKIAISIAGMEGTAIMARDLKMRWLEQGKVDAKTAGMYNHAHHDLTLYTQLMSTDLSEAGTGHDTESYFCMLKKLYPGSRMSVNQLKALSLINFLDPMTLYTWQSTYRYVMDGKDAPVKLFSIKDVKFLPNFRLGYAPYGPEVYLESFFLPKSKKPIYTYIKGGTFSTNKYLGLGIHHPSIISLKAHHFGLKLDAWHHPKLQLKQNNIAFEDFYNPDIEDYGLTKAQKKAHPGAALCATYQFSEADSYWNSKLEVGMKTNGFLPGESLTKAPLIRGSIGFKF